MAGFELTEFVLLACEFVAAPIADELAEESDRGELGAARETVDATQLEQAGDARENQADDEASYQFVQTLDLSGVRLDYGVSENHDAREFTVVIEATLVEEGLPYRLHVITGGRVTMPDDPTVGAEAAASTLLFVCYPYLREIVSAITARSPYPAKFLPPLTKLPHPRVRDVETAE